MNGDARMCLEPGCSRWLRGRAWCDEHAPKTKRLAAPVGWWVQPVMVAVFGLAFAGLFFWVGVELARFENRQHPCVCGSQTP